MKRLLSFAVVAALLASSSIALAAPQGHGNGHGNGNGNGGGNDNSARWDDGDRGNGHNPKDEGRHDNGKHKGWYKKGDRLPDYYYSRQYYVTDYERYHLRRPEQGYRWVRAEGGQFYLTLISSGVVIDISAGL